MFDVVPTSKNVAVLHRTGCLVTNRRAFGAVTEQLLEHRNGLALVGRLQAARVRMGRDGLAIAVLSEVWQCDPRTAARTCAELVAVGALREHRGRLRDGLGRRDGGWLATHCASWLALKDTLFACANAETATIEWEGRVSPWAALGAFELLRHTPDPARARTGGELAGLWRAHRVTVNAALASLVRVRCVQRQERRGGWVLPVMAGWTVEGRVGAPGLARPWQLLARLVSLFVPRTCAQVPAQSRAQVRALPGPLSRDDAELSLKSLKSLSKSPPTPPQADRSTGAGRETKNPLGTLATDVLQRLGLKGTRAGSGFARTMEFLCEAVPDAQATDFAAVLKKVPLSGARDPVAVLTVRGRGLAGELGARVQSRQAAAVRQQKLLQFDRLCEDGMEIDQAMRVAGLTAELREVS